MIKLVYNFIKINLFVRFKKGIRQILYSPVYQKHVFLNIYLKSNLPTEILKGRSILTVQR